MPPQLTRDCQHCRKKTIFEYVRDAARGGWKLYRCMECWHQIYVDTRRRTRDEHLVAL